MKISVFGLGYVGCVTAICFAKIGHEVIGFDINETKIAKLREGKSPIKEKDLDVLLNEAIQKNKFKVTDDVPFAVENSEVSFVCVRTPSKEDGGLDTSAIENVGQNIARALINNRNKRHIIVIRSTIPSGTIEKLNNIFMELGLIKGKDFSIASNPEFMREGTAVRDFFNPPHMVIGSDNDEVFDIISSLYKDINAPIFKVSTKTAEIIKFVNNSWHALKLSFINEISSICKELNIDTKELIDLFCSDTKLNLSSYYFRPSIGYGGSCLPKDLEAFQRIAVKSGINCTILNSISESNIQQIKRAYQLVKKEAEFKGEKTIGIYGISFKPGSDDIRGSPIIYVIEKLASAGFTVKIYDPIIKKEEIENIRRSYKEVIYDPLLNSLMEVKNFKDLLDDIENTLCPLQAILNCNIIVANSSIPLSELEKLKATQSIIDTQGVIPIGEIKKIKAKYITLW